MRWTLVAVGLVVVLLLVFSYVLDITRGRIGEFDYAGAAQVIDGHTIGFDGVPLRLYGIDAPDLDQICSSPEGAPYPCGRMAAANLERLLQGVEVVCRRTDGDGAIEAVVRCSFDLIDLNTHLVLSGWAVADLEEGSEYRPAEAAAKRLGAGMWQGEFDRPGEWRRKRAAG